MYLQEDVSISQDLMVKLVKLTSTWVKEHLENHQIILMIRMYLDIQVDLRNSQRNHQMNSNHKKLIKTFLKIHHLKINQLLIT